MAAFVTGTVQVSISAPEPPPPSGLAGGRPSQRLPEPQHVAFTIAHRELLHLVRFLDGRPVDDVRSACPQLRVQGSRIADPEERVPRSALLLVGADALGRR